jgi:hypothetical protein
MVKNVYAIMSLAATGAGHRELTRHYQDPLPHNRPPQTRGPASTTSLETTDLKVPNDTRRCSTKRSDAASSIVDVTCLDW